MLFRPYNAWIIPSFYLRDKAIELTRYNVGQLHVIAPCIDMEYYENDTLTRKAARKILDLPDNRIIIGSIGRYDLKRKQDFLIRSIQFLHRHNYDIDLLIMGKTNFLVGPSPIVCSVESIIPELTSVGGRITPHQFPFLPGIIKMTF